MTTFAAVFIEISTAYEVVENIAGRIFHMMRELDISDLDAWNDHMAKAYAENGWSTTTGRPKAGATETPAPDIIQVYVSRVRSGFKAGLNVKTFETMYQLLKATRDAGETKSHAQDAERLPELKGVQIANENKLTGAFCHDIAVYTRVLPEDKRLEMEDRVRKVMKRYERYVYKALSE